MGAGTPLIVERGIVIDDVTIVSTRDGSLAPGKAIFVENGSIREVREAGSSQGSVCFEDRPGEND